MPPVFDLEVLAADRKVYSSRVSSVTLPGVDGHFGVLRGHAPMYAALTVGCVTITSAEGGQLCIAISGGFAQVTPDRVTVLADTAELAESIDVERARQALERAQERLHAVGRDVDVDRAKAALLRAINRLRTAERRQGG